MVQGVAATDTIDARLAQPLTVEVHRDDGTLAHGAVVRFESLPPADPARRSEAAIYVCAVKAATCGQTNGALSSASLIALDTADASGIASVAVRLGRVAGEALVRIVVQEIGVADTVRFTVLPGAPGIVRVVVSDTALGIGGTAFLPAPRVTDRYNNTIPVVPTISSGPGNVFTLNPATGVITANAIGTQYLYARVGAIADSTRVRVPPVGRLVVWVPSQRAVRLVDVSGTGLVRTLFQATVSSIIGVFPRFDATRQRIVLHQGPEAVFGGSSNMVTVIDTSGANRRDIGGPGVFSTVINERQLADGSLLVVARRVEEAASAPLSLWRVATDNTLTLVATLPGLAATAYGGADISHDGTRVAYIASASSSGELRVLVAASGTFTIIDPNARAPRWSAQGDRLAFLVPGGNSGSFDGTMAVINSDGTGRRTFGNSIYNPGIAWSPDGVYVVASTFGTLTVIRLSDGMEMQLKIRNEGGTVEGVLQPDWR